MMYNLHNKGNQRWNIVYLDQKAKEQTKGLNKQFGFHINRPFYIVSKMTMGRVVEANGGNTLKIMRM